MSTGFSVRRYSSASVSPAAASFSRIQGNMAMPRMSCHRIRLPRYFPSLSIGAKLVCAPSTLMPRMASADTAPEASAPAMASMAPDVICAGSCSARPSGV